MAGGLPEPARIDADAPDAAAALTAAVASADAVLVHRADVEFTQGAVERLVRVLHRPHRRLVRVHTGGGSCYLARTELLALAIRHGVPAAMLVADPPGLDREIALATEAVALDGPTPVDDPAAGRWRQWVDGAVIGIRTTTAADPRWADEVARRSRPWSAATALLRRRAGRVRREVVRLGQRPQR